MSIKPGEGAAPPNLQLQWALYYFKLGWSVVPGHKLIDGVCTCSHKKNCASPGKHPAVAWTQYQKVRADKDQLRRWFGPDGPFRDYNVGIVTGAASGNLFVVDVDEGPGKPGSETLIALQMKYGDLPDTTQARTGGGGRHHMLTAPEGFIVKTDRNILGPGVDTRGSGGYFVAAPSLHQSGNYYVWDENYHPERIKPQPAPEWLLALIKNDTARVGSGSGGTPSVNQAEISPFGFVRDGREKYMVKVICGCIGSYVRENGTLPDPDELFREAWPTYSRNTKARGISLEADGRGESLMKQRIGYHLRRSATGAFPIFATVQQEIEEAAIKAGLEGAAPPAEPDPDVLPVDRGEPSARVLAGTADRAWELLWARAIEPSIAALDFVEDLLCEGQMSVVYGESGCGKTFFMTDIAFHVALGKMWRGKHVDQGGVIYCALEGSHGIKNRVAALKQHFKMYDVDIPLAVLATSVNLLDPDADTDKLIEQIKEAAETCGFPIKLVVIDTLSRALSGGNENAPDDMGAIVINADKIRRITGAHLCFIHHSGKNQALGARGHSLLRAATDTEIEITRLEGSDISNAKVAKQRELEMGGEFAFKLLSVELGINRRHKPVTSCVVTPILNASAAEVVPPKGKNLSPAQDDLHKLMVNLFAAEGRAYSATPESGMQPQMCVTRDTLRDHLIQSGYLYTVGNDKGGMVLGEGESKRLHDRLNELRSKDKIGMLRNLVWLLN